MRKTSIVAVLILTIMAARTECAGFDFSFGIAKSEKIKYANALLIKGDRDGAAAVYRELLAEEPDSDIVNYNMGAALYEGGTYEKAIDYFRKSASTENSSFEMDSFFSLGNSYYRLSEQAERGDIDASIALCEKALQYYTFVVENYDAGRKFKHNCEAAERRIKALKTKKNMLEILTRSGGEGSGGASSEPVAEQDIKKPLSSSNRQQRRPSGGDRKQPRQAQASGVPGKQQQQDRPSERPGQQQSRQAGERQSQPSEESRKEQLSQARQKAEDKASSLEDALQKQRRQSLQDIARKGQSLDQARKRREASESMPQELIEELIRDVLQKESDLQEARDEASKKEESLKEGIKDAQRQAEEMQAPPEGKGEDFSTQEKKLLSDEPQEEDQMQKIPEKSREPPDQPKEDGPKVETPISEEMAKIILIDYQDAEAPRTVIRQELPNSYDDVKKDW
ncbi:MAG: tetratricopeptide repeat protein [Candidatus Omnitrophota bacterium]